MIEINLPPPGTHHRMQTRASPCTVSGQPSAVVPTASTARRSTDSSTDSLPLRRPMAQTRRVPS